MPVVSDAEYEYEVPKEFAPKKKGRAISDDEYEYEVPRDTGMHQSVPKPAFAGKAMGEEPGTGILKTALAPSTYTNAHSNLPEGSVEGALPPPATDKTPAPIVSPQPNTAAPTDASTGYKSEEDQYDYEVPDQLQGGIPPVSALRDEGFKKAPTPPVTPTLGLTPHPLEAVLAPPQRQAIAAARGTAGLFDTAKQGMDVISGPVIDQNRLFAEREVKQAELAALREQQAKENAQIPSTARIALQGLGGIVPVSQGPPLQAPAKPGVPLTPTGPVAGQTAPGTPLDLAINRAAGPETIPGMFAEELVKAGPQASSWMAERAIPKEGGGILPNIQDPGLRELGRAIIGSTQPTTTGPQFAAAIATPEMAALGGITGLASALGKPAIAAKLGKIALDYFSMEGAKGAGDAAVVLLDENSTPEARLEAVKSLPTSLIMSALGPMHAKGPDVKAQAEELKGAMKAADYGEQKQNRVEQAELRREIFSRNAPEARPKEAEVALPLAVKEAPAVEEAAPPPLRPEPVEGSSPEPIPPPGQRWTSDRGAMPGEPFAFLDGDMDTAKAALVERQTQNGVLYEATTGEGQSLGQFPTIEEAARAAEAHVPPAEKQPPVEVRPAATPPTTPITPKDIDVARPVSERPPLPRGKVYVSVNDPAKQIVVQPIPGDKTDRARAIHFENGTETKRVEYPGTGYAKRDILKSGFKEETPRVQLDENGQRIYKTSPLARFKAQAPGIAKGEVPDRVLDSIEGISSVESAGRVLDNIRARIASLKERQGEPGVRSDLWDAEALSNLLELKVRALRAGEGTPEHRHAKDAIEFVRALNVERGRAKADAAEATDAATIKEGPEYTAEDRAELENEPFTPGEKAWLERELYDESTGAAEAKQATADASSKEGEASRIETPEPAVTKEGPAPVETGAADLLQQPGEAVHAGGPDVVGRPKPGGTRGTVEPETERFAASDATAGIFNDIFGTRSPGKKTQLEGRDPLAAARPEVEARIATAEAGLEGPTIRQKVSEAAQSVVQSFRRHFRHIDSGESPAMALNQDILRQYEAVPEYAKQVASDSLGHIVEGLDKDGLKVFQRILALRDFSRSVEEGLYDGKSLPFGYDSLEEAKADLSKYERAANIPGNPAIRQALDRREKFAKDLVERLVAEDLLPADVLRDRRYYHRQVLAYFDMRDPQAVGTGSSDVRLHKKGFQKERVGGSDFNLKYQEAEFEWMSQATSLLQTTETLRRLKEVNDIAPSLRRQADHLNEVAAYGGEAKWKEAQDLRGELTMLRESGDAKESDVKKAMAAIHGRLDEIDVLAPFRQQKAISISQLAKMAEKGALDHVPENHQEAVRELAARRAGEGEAYESDDPSGERGRFFGLLNYLLEAKGLDGEPSTGSGPAAGFFKAVADQKTFIKETAGKDFKTFRNLIPEEHPAAPLNRAVIWQPKKGNRFFLARTFPERALALLNDKLEEGIPGVSAEELRAFLDKGRDALVSGGRNEEWVIPENLAKTLDDWRPGQHETGLQKVQGDLLTTWKQWVLLNPVRALKYNLNNMSGDVDAVIAAYPGALKEFGRAATDLWRYNVKERGASQELVAELQGAAKRGVIGSGLSFQEIPDINRIGAFKALTSENPNVVQQALERYWSGTKKLSVWRENALRLALYRHLLGRLRGGEKGFYGASRIGEVEAIKDVNDRAAKVSRELVGDYGNISVAGQYIRRHIVPFYAWMEINLPRYTRLLRNAARNEGVGSAAKKGAVAAAGGVASFAIRASILYAAVQTWNHTRYPEEEKKLGRDRNQLHLIVGRGEDGTIRSVRFQGALSDALDWFSLGNVVSDVTQMRAGKKTAADMVAEAAKAPANKIVQGWEPMSKTLFELRSGTKSYPSIFKEGTKWEFANRPIRDRAEYLGDIAWPLGDLHRRVTGKPRRPTMDLGVPGAGPLLENLVMFKTDPGESAYWATRDNVRRWQESQGKGGGGVPELGGETKKKSDALYYFRKASEWGDDAAAKKWLKEYFAAGGTLESVNKNIEHSSPLAGLPIADRDRFRKSLRPEDAALLKEAEEWTKKGQVAMKRGLGERDYVVPKPTKRTPSVYSDQKSPARLFR